MRQPTCNFCEHFCRHYTLDQKRIFRVHCGHCTYPKIKAKKPDAGICGKYSRKEPDENAFVSKEYLSRVLLDYVTKLELLPEIQRLNEE